MPESSETTTNDFDGTNTPTGYLADSIKTRLLKEINDSQGDTRTLQGVYQILRDSLDQRFTDIFDYLVENLPPEVLLHDHLFDDNIIFTTIKHIREKVNTTFSKDRNVRVYEKLATVMYSGTEMMNYAQRIINNHINAATKPVGSSSNFHIVYHNIDSSDYKNNDLSKKKQNVVLSFKEDEKYSGSVTCKAPLHRVIQKFKTLVTGQEIPKEHVVSLLYCFLSGMALDYFYSTIQDKIQSLEEAILHLNKQFNSFQYQSQARTYLNNLSLRSVMKEKSCSTLQALEILNQRILDVGPSCGPAWESETTKRIHTDKIS